MGRIIGLTFPADTAGEAPGKDAETFSCPHCGKGYKSQASLTKHIKDKHPETAEPQE